jgi:hypothetical protein
MSVLYTFRVRDGRTGKWRTTRHKMTIKDVADRYRDDTYEPVEASKEVQPIGRRLLRNIFKFSR